VKGAAGFVALSALIALAGAGCGSKAKQAAPTPGRPTTTQSVTEPAPPPPERASHCTPLTADGYRACVHELRRRCRQDEYKVGECELDAWVTIRSRATVETKRNGVWRVVAHQPPKTLHMNMVVGHWRDAWSSPDGRTVLLEWSAECEVPTAFFAPASGGALRPVTGEPDWWSSPESVGLGWAADGRARVLLLEGVCGTGAREPGEYLIDPGSGDLERVGPLPSADG
jgi:hypothetical protein